ncbi:MAG TPA: hypothetical protein GXX46_03160 [Peptococcaceae bacterium]|nr:hypothetical protein [Peptococcaceae bacterium]
MRDAQDVVGDTMNGEDEDMVEIDMDSKELCQDWHYVLKSSTKNPYKQLYT